MKALTINDLDILQGLVHQLQENSQVDIDEDGMACVCGICGSEFKTTRDTHDLGCAYEILPELWEKLERGITEKHKKETRSLSYFNK